MSADSATTTGYPRTALQDLPVNVSGVPAMTRPSEYCSLLKGRKRSFTEVESATLAKSEARIRYPFLEAPLKARNINVPCTEGAPKPYVSLRVSEVEIHADALKSFNEDIAPRKTEEAAVDVDAGDSPESEAESPARRSDLEDAMTSQRTEATEVTQPPPSVAESVRSQSRSRYSTNEQSQAELLRLRLRIALFKVRTGQTCIPLSRVEIDCESRRFSSEPPDQAPRSAQAFRVLHSPPTLKPTTFSARTMLNPQALSSPPPSANTSPGAATSNDGFKTPALPRRTALPSCVIHDGPQESLGEKGFAHKEEEENIPSSVMKQNVARSLMGLSQHAADTAP